MFIVVFFCFIQLPDLGPINAPENSRHLIGYYKIARHYGFSLNHIFNELNYEGVIITEGLLIL